MKKYRVGVIGLGMGRGHIEGYRSHATGAEGLVVMELLDAIYENARCGKPVAIG